MNIVYNIKVKTLAFLFLTFSLQAKVESPNYNFNLDTLNIFFPGNELPKKSKNISAPKLINENKGVLLYEYHVSYLRYKFPVMVQVQEKKILDFYATLPRYFLHDTFHQSLINRYGNQDSFAKVENQAIYKWENKKNMKHIYAGTCTITCFPVYYTVWKSDKDPKQKSILESLSTSK